jgi:hypothetical protein
MAATTLPSSPARMVRTLAISQLADRHLDLASDLARHGDRGIGSGLQREQADRVHADLRAGAGDVQHRRSARAARAALGDVAAVPSSEAVQLVEELPQIGCRSCLLGSPTIKSS